MADQKLQRATMKKGEREMTNKTYSMNARELVLQMAADILEQQDDDELASALRDVRVQARDGGPYLRVLIARPSHHDDSPIFAGHGRYYLDAERALDDVAAANNPACPIVAEVLLVTPLGLVRRQ